MAEEDVNEAGNAEVEAPQAAGPSSQKNPLVAVLLVFNMIGLGAVAFFQYQFMQKEASKPDLTKLLEESKKAHFIKTMAISQSIRRQMQMREEMSWVDDWLRGERY